MSGLVKSVGKVFKKLAKSKVVKGLAIAAAIYFTAGIAAGAMGSTTAAGLPGIRGAADLLGLGETGAFAGAPPGADAMAAGQSVASPLPDTAAPQGTDLTQGPDAATEMGQQAQQPQPQQAQAPTPPPTQPGPKPGLPPVDEKSVRAQPAAANLKLPQSGGVINNAAGWFSGLSAPAQEVLARGFAGGAAGLMQALAMKNASEDAEERENRAREDRIRRGSVPDFSSAFSKGVIDSKRGT